MDNSLILQQFYQILFGFGDTFGLASIIGYAVFRAVKESLVYFIDNWAKQHPNIATVDQLKQSKADTIQFVSDFMSIKHPPLDINNNPTQITSR